MSKLIIKRATKLDMLLNTICDMLPPNHEFIKSYCNMNIVEGGGCNCPLNPNAVSKVTIKSYSQLVEWLTANNIKVIATNEHITLQCEVNDE